MNPEILDDPSPEKTPLASRASRLGAFLLDAIITAPISFFVFYFYLDFPNYLENSSSDEFVSMLSNLGGYDVLVISIPSILGYVVINYFTLEKSGQSLGKKVVGIKIITLEHQLPPIRKLVFERYILIQIMGLLPLVGALFSIADVLMIFGQDRRCLHDIIAQTQVVKA